MQSGLGKAAMPCLPSENKWEFNWRECQGMLGDWVVADLSSKFWQAGLGSWPLPMDRPGFASLHCPDSAHESHTLGRGAGAGRPGQISGGRPVTEDSKDASAERSRVIEVEGGSQGFG